MVFVFVGVGGARGSPSVSRLERVLGGELRDAPGGVGVATLHRAPERRELAR